MVKVTVSVLDRSVVSVAVTVAFCPPPAKLHCSAAKLFSEIFALISPLAKLTTTLAKSWFISITLPVIDIH